MGRRRTADLTAILGVAAVAVAYVAGVMWPRAQRGMGNPSIDIYMADYPNLLYALRSLKAGHGLLWNPMQNCGQPFLPSTLLGLFYPGHLLFLVLDVSSGLFVLAALHLAIGGVGTYLLGRELGLRPTGAACSALAFELGGSALSIAYWIPTTILAVFVWMPWAVWLCERLLRRPTLRGAIALGVVLTLQLLPAYPQPLFFTYQLIALRVLWELLTVRMERRLAALGAILLGLALPVLLGAVQLLPMLEYMHQSVRDRTLTLEEIEPSHFDWQGFRAAVNMRGIGLGTLFGVVPAALAAGAFVVRGRRRLPIFYLLVGVLYFALSFRTPLQAFYLGLPLGSTFREPQRFLWMTGFAVNVLAGFGVEAIDGERPDVAGLLARLAALALGAAGLYLLSPAGLIRVEWALLGALAVACVVAARFRWGLRVTRLALPVLLLANLLGVGWSFFGFKANGDDFLYARRAVFDFVRQQMTPQDRMYQTGIFPDFGLQPKSPTVYGIPSITDYEPQTSEPYAELYIMLMHNIRMTSINQIVFPGTVPVNRPILDLLATRYLVGSFPPRMAVTLWPPLPLVWDRDGVRVYENTHALPRAFYVPRAEVVPDPAVRLQRLGSATNDPRQVALIERPPADGFFGGAGTGTVTALEDRSEEVVMSLSATAEGFLFVSDQDYPGWEATVNGVPTPILRANHAFRLVRVPAGASTVVFRYRPWSVRLGVVVSLLSAGVLAISAIARFSGWSRGSLAP